MKTISAFLVCVFFSAGLCGPLYARGKAYPLIAEGEYFSIYAYPGMDVQDLLEKINFDSFFQVDGLDTVMDSPRDITAKTFDAVYLEVSDAIGISAYSFTGKIKIFPNQKELSDEFRALFGRDFPERAFYLHEKKTLYFSHEDIHIGMLVHEMAHIAMSNYFVIPPSPKLQEILSGYVEYHFRRRLNMPLK